MLDLRQIEPNVVPTHRVFNKQGVIDHLNKVCAKHHIDKSDLFIIKATAVLFHGDISGVRNISVGIRADLWATFIAKHASKDGSFIDSRSPFLGSMPFQKQDADYVHLDGVRFEPLCIEVRLWEDDSGYRTTTEFQHLLTMLHRSGIGNKELGVFCQRVVDKIKSFPDDGCALMRWMTPRQGQTRILLNDWEKACVLRDREKLTVLAADYYPELSMRGVFGATKPDRASYAQIVAGHAMLSGSAEDLSIKTDRESLPRTKWDWSKVLEGSHAKAFTPLQLAEFIIDWVGGLEQLHSFVPKFTMYPPQVLGAMFTNTRVSAFDPALLSTLPLAVKVNLAEALESTKSADMGRYPERIDLIIEAFALGYTQCVNAKPL